MKAVLLSKSDIIGGAARATYRLHQSLLSQKIDSTISARVKSTDDHTIQGPKNNSQLFLNKIRSYAGEKINLFQNDRNPIFHSCNLLPSNWSKNINSGDADVINLHWIGGETMSIEDIGRITKPLVWTLHDMWAFCGAEHYTFDTRWIDGYTKSNRQKHEQGIDLNKSTWERKRKAWDGQHHIISPSRWLTDCAQKSALFIKSNIYTIPNTLDTQVFKPLSQEFCREALNLPQNTNIILFGAIGGGKDPRKGEKLLTEALCYIQEKTTLNQNTICLVFGESKPQHINTPPLPTYWLGHIHDETTLALLYNAVTVMIVPSKQENLPQTATEAHACGCPVVAFNCTGLTDVVIHMETGYLAKAYDTLDLALGIEWVLSDYQRYMQLKVNARQRALSLWSPEIIAPQYVEVYQRAIDAQKLKPR